jgi:hypothetical protein
MIPNMAKGLGQDNGKRGLLDVSKTDCKLVYFDNTHAYATQ